MDDLEWQWFLMQIGSNLALRLIWTRDSGMAQMTESLLIFFFALQLILAVNASRFLVSFCALSNNRCSG